MSTSHTVTLGGLNFHYVEWGGAGTPIILLHGLASTVHIWDLVAPRLTTQGSVTALDQRGHGLSSQPPTGYDFATIGEDLARFVHALGIQERFFLVGHSWGAYVTLAFAHSHGDMLQGAVLVDGGVMDLKSQSPTWEIAEARMTPPAMHDKTVAEVQEMIKQHWLGAAWTPETGEMAFQVYKIDEQGFVDRRLQLANHMQIARAIWEFTPAEHFAQIQCPLLLVVPIPPGMSQQPDPWQQDKEQQVRKAIALIPHGEIAWFPETIHDIPWQRPVQLADTITDFVKRHQG
jgi:pimeloyl-ACP methyl ester carboxylesterase